MRIKEVEKAIFYTRKNAFRESGGREPKIKIYMDYDYWHECMQEIKGGVSCCSEEFYRHHTVCGYKVWRVISNVDGSSHSPFEVINCGYLEKGEFDECR